jgi:uncharacterized membrane protein required for colicin V production
VLLTILLLLIFAACMAFLYQEGLWGNLIRLVNVVTSALLAMNYFEPAADWFEEMQPSYSYVWDFIALWAVFALSMGILRTATDLLSRVKVRFMGIVDRTGGIILSGWIGLIMVMFTTTSLHVAPLAREPLRGSFVPEQRAESSMELYWLGLVQRLSMNQLARGLSEDELRQGVYGPTSDETAPVAVFDAEGVFIPKYATRRARLEAYAESNDAIRVR